MSGKKLSISEQLPVVAAVLVLVLVSILAGMLGNKGAGEQRRVELTELVLAALRERHLQPEFSTEECRRRVARTQATKWRQNGEHAEGRIARLARFLKEGEAEESIGAAMGAWWLHEKGAEEALLAKLKTEVGARVPKADPQKERWRSKCRWMVGILSSRIGEDELAVNELEKLLSGGAASLREDERLLVAVDFARSLEEAARYEETRQAVARLLEGSNENTGTSILGEFPLKVWSAKLDRKAGNLERAKADLKGLLREAERANRRDDWQVEALAELGRVLFLQWQKDGLVLMQEAIAMRAMRSQKDHPKVLEDQVWLAGALRVAGQRAEAMNLVEEVIEQVQRANVESDARYPTARAWLEKGEILRANGDLEGAKKAVERGMKGSEIPKNAELQVRAAAIMGARSLPTVADEEPKPVE